MAIAKRIKDNLWCNKLQLDPHGRWWLSKGTRLTYIPAGVSLKIGTLPKNTNEWTSENSAHVNEEKAYK